MSVAEERVPAPVAAPTPLTDAGMSFLMRAAVSASDETQAARDYYAGEHDNTLTDAQKDVLEGLVSVATDADKTVLGAPVDNQCRVIVETVRGRLSVAKVVCADADVQQAIEEDWTLNGLSDRQHDAHRNTLRDGNGYLVLGWDNARGRVTMDVHPQWVAGDGVGGEGVHLVYDDAGAPLVAVKEWVVQLDDVTTQRRRTLYWPDRIERYAEAPRSGDAPATPVETETGQWQPYVLPSDNGQWPVPWVHPSQRTPLGIPVVHFVNERDDLSAYGASELTKPIRSLQDAANDELRSLLAANRMTAYQMITAMGVSKEDAEQWNVGPGQVLGSSNAEAKIGFIPAGTLEPILRSYNKVLERMARNADIPVHAITGDWPSGEALLREEIPLIARAQVRQERFGRAWASALHKATLLRNAFGGENLNAEALITVEWDDAALHDPLYRATVVQIKGPYLSHRQKLRELGYTEERVTQIIEEIEAERRGGVATPVAAPTDAARAGSQRAVVAQPTVRSTTDGRGE